MDKSSTIAFSGREDCSFYSQGTFLCLSIFVLADMEHYSSFQTGIPPLFRTWLIIGLRLPNSRTFAGWRLGKAYPEVLDVGLVLLDEVRCRFCAFIGDYVETTNWGSASSSLWRKHDPSLPHR
jgi:hypothetical protein